MIDFTDYAYCFNCKYFNWESQNCTHLNKNVDFGSTCINFTEKSQLTPDQFQKEYNLMQKRKEVDKCVLDISNEVIEQIARKENNNATELMVDFILSKENIYTIRNDEKTEMWIYQKGIYIPQGKSFIQEYVRSILKKTYTTYLCNQVISKIEADTFIESKDFFSNKIINEIPVSNGLLNIFTKKLSDFTPNKIFFGKLPIKFDKDKQCENIINHFKTVLKNDDDIKVIQELFGYLLLKDYKIEKAVMFNGSGRNGKSKTLELMKRFIGAENCSSISLELLENDIFSPSGLFGKMANLCGDLSPTALKNTGIFKQMTGRDLITAPRKFLPPIYFENFAKLVFSCNQLPISYDITSAFWERWVYLEFPYTFKTKEEIEKTPEKERINLKEIDPDIMQKLSNDDEMSGLLNWALDGLSRLLQNKDFSYSKSAKEVQIIWTRKADNFKAFLMDNIMQDYEWSVTKEDLRRSYNDYCKEHHLIPCCDKHIRQVLTSEYGVIDNRKTKDDDFVTCWSGIAFIKGIKGINGFSAYSKK